MSEPLHLLREYFAAKKIVENLFIQLKTGKISENDKLEMLELNSRVVKFELENNIKNGK